MTTLKETVYDESKILTLSSLEHIRLRPGMYIGRLGNGSHPSDGIYVLLKEIVDNSIDEFIMGYGKRIDIHIDNGSVNIRDFGRGIPLGKVVECVSIINTGAKYNDEVFQFSVGLNGVGTKAVNALSEHFEVSSYREKKQFSARFKSGELETKPITQDTNQSNGTKISFIPDTKLFPNYSYDLGTIRKQLWNYAYLNRKLTITLNGEKFKSENGLLDLLQEEVNDANLYQTVRNITATSTAITQTTAALTFPLFERVSSRESTNFSIQVLKVRMSETGLSVR